MVTRIDVKKIIAGNPRVDPEQFQRAQDAAKALAEQGVVPIKFGLRLPYEYPRQAEPPLVHTTKGVRQIRRRRKR